MVQGFRPSRQLHSLLQTLANKGKPIDLAIFHGYEDGMAFPVASGSMEGIEPWWQGTVKLLQSEGGKPGLFGHLENGREVQRFWFLGDTLTTGCGCRQWPRVVGAVRCVSVAEERPI